MLTVNIVRSRQFASVEFTRQDMIKIGARAVQSIQDRCSKARGVRDQPMPPLSRQWAAAKRKMGQPGIRNLMFSGSMLGALTVVEADSRRAVIGFTRRAELSKAVANQQRSPWFGLSPTDETNVQNYADRLMRTKLK